MISFIVKANNLRSLTKFFLNTDASGFLIQTRFRRTLFAKNILLSRRIIKNEIDSSENEKNLGKVIELCDNFDEVELEEEEITKARRKRPSSDKSKPKKYLGDNIAALSSEMTSLKLKKNRELRGEVILEGKRLIKDAISAGCLPEKIFYSREEDVNSMQLPKEIKLYKVPYKTLTLWTDVVTPQGVLGILKIPKRIAVDNSQKLPLSVICDNVRDPRNLGSMLRVVAGVGCEKIILMKGCTDVWDPKVLRVGCGAHFRIPIISNLMWSDLENEISSDTRVLLADMNRSSSDTAENEVDNSDIFRRMYGISEDLPLHSYYSLKYGDERTVVIIGGETYGISYEAYKFAFDRKGSKIFIPMSNQFESLNNSMTLGIIAYEFRRQFDLNKQDDISEQLTEAHRT